MRDSKQRRHNSTIRNSRNGFGTLRNTYNAVDSAKKVDGNMRTHSYSPEGGKGGAPVSGEEASNINILPKLT